VPLFYSPETLARGLRALLDYHAWRDQRTTARVATTEPTAAQAQVIARLNSSTRATWSESEAKTVLAAWDVPVTRERLVGSLAEAAAAATTIGYPVALKVDSPDIPHKTEAGAVQLDVADEAALRVAYETILANARRHAPAAAINGVLVQQMVHGGVETIVGVQYDPQMGPMLLFGTGGIMVEVYEDVALRRCPIDRDEALRMIGDVKGARLLQGYRGKPKADIAALADLLVRVSAMAVALDGTATELDINPVMVMPEGRGVVAADALLFLKK